jgi:STAM-binding protein
MFSSAPPSVAQVVAQAGNYTYNAAIPLAAWLRTASTMQKEAQVYEAEANDAQTYLLLYRHADLVLQHLQTHPQRAAPENRRALNAATAQVRRDLKKLEVLAPRIKARHDEYAESRARQAEARSHDKLHLDSSLDLDLDLDSSLDAHVRPALDASALENHSLAARLAQREVWRRHSQHTSPGPDDDLSSRMHEIARLQQRPLSQSSAQPRPPQPYQPSQTPYHYPTVPHASAQERWSQSQSQQDPSALPARPPKEAIYRPTGTPAIPPPLPPKPLTPTYPHPTWSNPPPIPAKYDTSTPPIPSKAPLDVPPSNDLDSFTFRPSAYLENGDPLRPVFLPSQLRSKFLACASSNTRLNLETCGMLVGILKSSALFITRLIIPEQTSTSDTCETLNEEEIFDYCDKEELLVVGWIHTHPTQTCFMSSRDLHTHVGYQVMMAESIAIVCAPTKQPRYVQFPL